MIAGQSCAAHIYMLQCLTSNRLCMFVCFVGRGQNVEKVDTQRAHLHAQKFGTQWNECCVITTTTELKKNNISYVIVSPHITSEVLFWQDVCLKCPASLEIYNYSLDAYNYY